MEYKIYRDGEYINKLKMEIEENYKLNIEKIVEGNRGVDGETWIIYLEEDKRIFAKIGYLKGHKERMKNSIIAINYLLENNVKNINKILLTQNNQTYINFNNGILVLFEFIDGEIDFNISYERVLINLIDIYKIGDNDIITKEDFEIEKLIRDLKKLINMAYEKNDELAKVLKKYNKQIDKDIETLRKVQKIVNKNTNKYITHGDACVNIIQGKLQDYIIDWDDALVAPIERDCWFFMNVDEKISHINSILLENKIEYKLSNEMLLFYAYKSYIIYLKDDIEKYLELKDKEILNNIQDLFDGWVRERMSSIKIYEMNY